MIIFWVQITTILILNSIAGIHFYWFVGGTFGLKAAIPMKDDLSPLFKIGKHGPLIVGLGLFSLSLLILDNTGFWGPISTKALSGNIYAGFSIIFLIRAIGDTNYVGFFSKKRKTLFHYWDMRLHSVISLILSGLLGLLFIL
jgi:hypothetical protein